MLAYVRTPENYLLLLFNIASMAGATGFMAHLDLWHFSCNYCNQTDSIKFHLIIESLCRETILKLTCLKELFIMMK